MLRKVVILIVVNFCFLITAYSVDISAKSAILYEADSGKILYQKDIYTRREMASTTKIMTALLTIENTNLDEIVCIKQEHTGAEGTSIYLKPNEKITVNTLLHGLMLQSGNDAAVALANYIAGSEEAFVEMMNTKAKQLGMKKTKFQNPNGLPDDEHYSTAYDMALLTAYAMKNEEFCEVVSKTTYQAEGRTFTNHNKLLRMSDIVDGVKTGFTKKAGRCLVSSASEDGMRLIAVTLSAPDDWNDHLALYDYGYSNYRKHIYFKKGEIITEIPVVSGKFKSIPVAAANEIYSIEEKAVLTKADVKIYSPHFIYAPIEKNEKVGEIKILRNGEVISKSDIISIQESDIIEKKAFMERVKDFFIKILSF